MPLPLAILATLATFLVSVTIVKIAIGFGLIGCIALIIFIGVFAAANIE